MFQSIIPELMPIYTCELFNFTNKKSSHSFQSIEKKHKEKLYYV